MRSRSRRVVRPAAALLVMLLLSSGAGAQSLKIVSDFDPTDTILFTAGALTSPSLSLTDSGTTSALQFFDSFSEGSTWSFSTLEGLELRVLSDGEVVVSADRGGIVLASDNPSQRYLVDLDEDDAVANHIWYENTTAGSPTDWRMMQLTEVSGGSLFVDGPVTQNHSFDLAETFWERLPIEPGELVAVDPDRSDAVLPTTAPYQTTVLGVASARPGFVLGGGAFSLDDLRRTWGEVIAEEFELARPELELQVLGEIPGLADQAERLRSRSSFEAYLVRQRDDRDATRGGDSPRPGAISAPEPSPEAIRRAYETAQSNHEELMFDRTLQRFFKERFAAVALAGRVPVKADASFGPILPGDYLTSSPVPGVAMKATRPGPVVGTALEALSQGSGVIQLFVHRGWYGGEGQQVGGARAPAPAAIDAKDREIAELRRRLAALEARLDLPSTGQPAPVPTVSSTLTESSTSLAVDAGRDSARGALPE